jgi:hypothetical protein
MKCVTLPQDHPISRVIHILNILTQIFDAPTISALMLVDWVNNVLCVLDMGHKSGAVFSLFSSPYVEV